MIKGHGEASFSRADFVNLLDSVMTTLNL